MSELKENHIIVGLGGTGGKILRAFKMRMFEEFPNKDDREKQPVALLYVDSTREMMGIGRQDMDVMGQDASFGENEFLYIKGCDVPDLLDNIGNHPELRGIVNNVSAVRTAIGNLGEAAGQKRRAGRLLFAVNASKYVSALGTCFAKCNERSHNISKNVHIFAGLCGGTGSGAIIDAIVQARNLWDDAQINVYAMIPEKDLPKAGMDQGRYYQNGYAALTELNALQCGRYQPCDVLGNGEPLNVFSESRHGVANVITVYSNVNSNGRIVDSFEELPKIVSDLLYSRIFLIKREARECEDIIRAYNYENKDVHFENDETVSPQQVMETREVPKVRTMKLNSFGLKRVIYPERRVLQHMTYSVGKSVLYQFRYNNWRTSLGFTNERNDYDYRAEYLNDDHLNHWMIDLAHLTLEEEVLTTKDGEKHDTFSKDWSSRVAEFADFCGQYENPLTQLRTQMDAMFNNQFREEGVRNYYKTKLKSLAQIVSVIRSNIEKELFNKWRDGNISIYELGKIGETLSSYVATDLNKKLDEETGKCKADINESEEKLSEISTDWSHVGFVGKFITKKKADYYAEYQDELVYYLMFQTRLVALDFARTLRSALQREIGKMSDDINAFSKMLSDTIDETDKLITKQQKTNKGLEDMRSAVIEVSEEERMVKYEEEICLDKEGMVEVARQLREAILPDTDFRSFGELLTQVNEKKIKHAFDVKLSQIIETKHSNLPASTTKVLGLNILTQLQQKLGNNQQKIMEFAGEILQQSGAYIDLDRNQIIANIRNNEQPNEGVNINCQETLISLPSPEDNPSLREFANDLKNAFENMAPTGVKPPKVFMESPRKNELSIITIRYAFPLRTVTWLTDYKKRYKKYLHTGNANTDLSRAILLHSEGLGEDLPDLFNKTDDELRRIDAEHEAAIAAQPMTAAQPTQAAPQPMAAGGAPVPPPPPGAPVPPPPMAEPQVSMYLYIGGQQYGPYDYATLKTFVPTKQLTPQTMVWQNGMAAWAPASQVTELQQLFAPATPPTPAAPPMPSAPVPPPMGM